MKSSLIVFSITSIAISASAAPQPKIQYAGDDAKRLAYAIGGARPTFPFNIFTVCNHDTECVQFAAKPGQDIDPNYIRRLIEQRSTALTPIKDPAQKIALRKELDRLGTFSSHVDALQTECAQNTVGQIYCAVTHAMEFDDLNPDLFPH